MKKPFTCFEKILLITMFELGFMALVLAIAGLVLQLQGIDIWIEVR